MQKESAVPLAVAFALLIAFATICPDAAVAKASAENESVARRPVNASPPPAGCAPLKKAMRPLVLNIEASPVSRLAFLAAVLNFRAMSVLLPHYGHIPGFLQSCILGFDIVLPGSCPIAGIIH